MTTLHLFLGIVVLVVVLTLAVLGRNPNAYDERQKLAQGRAATAALLCLVIFQLGAAAAQELAGARWFRLLSLSYAGLCVAAAVYGACCIWADAFVPVGESPLRTWLCSGACLACVVLPRLVKGELSRLTEADGALSAGAMLLFLLAVPALWLLALALRRLRRREP